MHFRLPIRGGVADDCKVRWVLLGQNKCQADIGKLNQCPGGILIDDLAAEFPGVQSMVFSEIRNGTAT